MLYHIYSLDYHVKFITGACVALVVTPHLWDIPSFSILEDVVYQLGDGGVSCVASKSGFRPLLFLTSCKPRQFFRPVRMRSVHIHSMCPCGAWLCVCDTCVIPDCLYQCGKCGIRIHKIQNKLLIAHTVYIIFTPDHLCEFPVR